MDASEESDGDVPGTGPSDDRPVGTLRGAGVAIDGPRAARMAVVLALVALLVVGGVLLVAGIRKNAQIDELKTRGVPVQVTVTRCLALVGGTGQSPAGYECTGTYAYGGRTYVRGLPGSANLPVGSVVAGVVSSGDPGLLSTPSTVSAEHTSASVYVLPAILFATAGAVVAWSLLRRRRRSRAGA
jgi:hypothetical protein